MFQRQFRRSELKLLLGFLLSIIVFDQLGVPSSLLEELSLAKRTCLLQLVRLNWRKHIFKSPKRPLRLPDQLRITFLHLAQKTAKFLLCLSRCDSFPLLKPVQISLAPNKIFLVQSKGIWLKFRDFLLLNIQTRFKSNFLHFFLTAFCLTLCDFFRPFFP